MSTGDHARTLALVVERVERLAQEVEITIGNALRLRLAADLAPPPAAAGPVSPTPPVRQYGPAEVAQSLRNCGDAVTLGGLDGLLALGGCRVLSLRSEPSRTGPTGHTWVALVAHSPTGPVVEGSGETLALALAAALGGGS